jgi:hypothetical protein
MSNKKNMDDTLAARGNWDTPDLPMDNSDWSVSGSVISDQGRPIGVNFSGSLDAATLGGEVKSGGASLNVGLNNSSLNVRYDRERVTGTVGYTVGNEQAKLSGTFDSRGNLTGSGTIKFKDATVDFSPSSIGATYDFGGGWRGTVSREFGGGVGINFSGGSSFGGGSSFSLSVGASGNGGEWGVNAKFQLTVLTSM